jgi:hypothetical protein
MERQRGMHWERIRSFNWHSFFYPLYR